MVEHGVAIDAVLELPTKLSHLMVTVQEQKKFKSFFLTTDLVFIGWKKMSIGLEIKS